MILAICVGIYAAISITGLNFTGTTLIKESAQTLALIAIVYLCASGMNNPAGSFLASAPMVYLGKISYGLYILHNFIPYVSSLVLGKFGISPMATFGPYGLFAINLVILIIIASLSWYLFESKINTFKKYFPYLPRKKNAEADVLIAESK